MKTIKAFFHQDSQHGWLAVKRTVLAEMGLLARVSHCSYERGGTVYLEEDADASMFMGEVKARGLDLKIASSSNRWVNRSPVRNYAGFSLREGE